MMLPQHLLALIKTSDDVNVVADNAKGLVKSSAEDDRSERPVSRPLQPTASMDTLPALPRSGLNQTAPIDEWNESPAIPPLCSVRISSSGRGSSSRSRRKQAKRCSAKSLPKKLNADRIKSFSRWDSGSIVSDDDSSICTPPTQQQTLSDLAKQKYRCAIVSRTSSMDRTNHCSALPLRLPRRQESFRGLNTAAMIEKVMGELDLMIDSENGDFIMEETATESCRRCSL
jgi:hypothetical protein